MGHMCTCPRCGSLSYETFKSHAYCYNCNFNSEESFGWNKTTSPVDIQIKKLLKINKR